MDLNIRNRVIADIIGSIAQQAEEIIKQAKDREQTELEINTLLIYRSLTEALMKEANRIYPTLEEVIDRGFTAISGEIHALIDELDKSTKKIVKTLNKITKQK